MSSFQLGIPNVLLIQFLDKEPSLWKWRAIQNISDFLFYFGEAQKEIYSGVVRNCLHPLT